MGVFILGVWLTVPSIERDLTARAKGVIQQMDLSDKVRVTFFGPVATVSGEVTDEATKRQVIDKINNLVSLWGLRVENEQKLLVVLPAQPIRYRLDFSNREIKVSGNIPGELEKKALLAKVRKLFPNYDKDDIKEDLFLQSQSNEGKTAENTNGLGLNLLDNLPSLHQGQFRWVTVEEGKLTVSANVSNQDAEQAFARAAQKLGAQVEDLKIIPTPTLDLKFSPANQYTLSGTLACEEDQTTAVEMIQALFSKKAKVTTECKFDETMGPVEWILPQLRPLPALQKLGKLTHVALNGPTPLIEAEAMNASAQISLSSAIDEAYSKNVKTNISLFTPVVNTITPPSVWVKIGEDETEVTGTVVDENGRKLLLTKLGTLFPNLKFKDQITVVPGLAPTALYAAYLDPMLDIPNLETSFILQGFGLVEGRLSFTGLVPETAAKDRLTGIILKRHAGKVHAEVAVDPSYLPSPDAGWSAKLIAGKLEVTGQFSSKQLKGELTKDLQEAFPGWEVKNEAEVLPSGLRKGAWADLFTGLTVVAAPQQITQISWVHDTLTLDARVPDEAAREAMEKRIKLTFGSTVQTRLEVVDDPLLRDLPAVALIDCTIYFTSGQKDFVALELPKIQRVLDVLEQHPELKISIEAHTDNKGSANINLNTSQLRADTVKKWFLRRKIDPERIIAKGFGSRRPVASLKTDAGRDASRRLEFRVR